MTAPLVIIGCGAAKRDLIPGELVAIGDLYNGNLYCARHRYAQIFGGPHLVVSGHHGLVPVSTQVATYELDLRASPASYRRAWNERVLHSLAKLVDPATPVIVLAAGPYLAWCGAARERGYQIEAPLEGQSIGASLSWLRRALAGRGPTVSVDDGRDYEAEADEVRRELERDQPENDEDFVIAAGALRALLGLSEARA